MNKNNYNLPVEEDFTSLLALEEASRCLLCEDAPCSASCPAQTDPGKFIRSLRFKNIDGAVDTIRLNNPLGGICARVCPTEKYCEKACSRCGIDRPINIGKLQQFITDYQEQTKYEVFKDVPNFKNKKIAIIGSGPSGLSAAFYLKIKGYAVDVYEKDPELGGYLRYGIPSYRLPNEVIDNEIKHIANIGVKFLPNSNIDSKIIKEQLLVNYDAVLLATGLHDSFILPMFENNSSVISAIDYLKDIKEHDGEVKPSSSILIIGGGDVAMDCALSSKKIGVSNVKVVARETFDIFPASKKELALTQRNNIDVYAGFTPDYIDENNKVVFKHTRDDSSLIINADKIVLAIGQRFSDQLNLEKDERHFIKTKNHMTSLKNLFATGDIVKGDKTVVYSVKLGKEAAESIDSYLGGK
ncbi:MAG: FAD-dependent oxidoreductase [Bacilli bacterium]